MYKISWGTVTDRHDRTCVLVSSAEALFDLYHLITGYGRKDGRVPADIQVTNLDGVPVDMSTGLANVAGLGTRL